MIARKGANTAGSGIANSLATTGSPVVVSGFAPPTTDTQTLTRVGWSEPAVTGLPEGWVSVADYGAVGDGTTDDTAAFLAAIATKKHVYIPVGTISSPKQYLVSSTLTLNESQEMYMPTTGRAHFALTTPWSTEWADQMSYIPACILTSCTTTNTITMNQRHSCLRGVYIRQKDGTTPTAGYHVDIGSWGTNRVYEPRLIDYVSENAYNGLRVYGTCQWSYLQRIFILNATHTSLELDIPAPWGDLMWDDIRLHSDARTNGGAACTGFYVRNIDTSVIGKMSIKYHTTPIKFAGDHDVTSLVAGASNGCHNLTIECLDVENANTTAGNEAVIFGGGTYDVKDIRINTFKPYTGGGLTNPLIVKMNTNTHNCYIGGGRWGGYKYKDYGYKNTLNGVQFDVATGGSYIAVDLFGTDGAVRNCYGDTFGTGIKLNAASNYMDISNNNFRTCSTPFNLDATAKATGRGVGNIGLADW